MSKKVSEIANDDDDVASLFCYTFDSLSEVIKTPTQPAEVVKILNMRSSIKKIHNQPIFEIKFQKKEREQESTNNDKL